MPRYNGQPIKILDWIVDPDSTEEFTELEFIGDIQNGVSNARLGAWIGLYDEEGLAEFSGRYWWKVIESEQGWIRKGQTQTFQESTIECRNTLESFDLEFAEFEENQARKDSEQ